jgi:hypothetical protein
MGKRGSLITGSIVLLHEYLILRTWTLPEVLHAVQHVSQCFLGCPHSVTATVVGCGVSSLDTEPFECRQDACVLLP